MLNEKWFENNTLNISIFLLVHFLYLVYYQAQVIMSLISTNKIIRNNMAIQQKSIQIKEENMNKLKDPYNRSILLSIHYSL